MTQHLINFSTLLLLIGLISCGKEDFEPDYTLGYAVAVKNGEGWVGKGRGAVNTRGIGIDMHYDVFDEIGQLRQQLAFSKIPLKVGTYNIYRISGQTTDSIPGCAFYTISHDGDVLEDIYRVVESEMESTVTVLTYDETKRLLAGEFRVKLYIDPDRPISNSANPDTILFELGKFEVTIEE